MTIERIELLAAWPGLVIAAAVLASQPAVAKQDDEAWARVVHVNCDRPGATIQQKVDDVRHARPTTILVKGTCTGDVMIRADDVTLEAHEDGGEVVGTIIVAGAQRFSVVGLRVSGAGDGVLAIDNASVTIRDAVLEENSGSGAVAVRNSLVSLYGNTIRMNGEYGVLVTDGGNAQIRAGNTIESDVPGAFNGGPIGGYRQANIRIRDGGNVIRHTGSMPPGDPQNSFTSNGMAIDVEHGTILRQDNGFAEIIGDVYVFNLTSADFRDASITGHIFIDGLNANFRLRNSSVVGGMNMFGEANFRNTVDFTGDIYCNFNFLNPGINHNGARIDCFPF